MSANRLRPRRRAYTTGALVIAAGSLFLVGSWPQSAISQSVEPITRIEEDWVIVLNEPDGNVNAPQFHTVMSPFPDFETTYAQVLWNYREQPEFVAGGVQLQSYLGEEMNRSKSMEFNKLHTTSEVITWTQVLETNGSTLTFEVTNGSSTTWGSFGKDMRLSSTVDLAALNNYDVEFSVQNSGVTYGSNRVDVMGINEVRAYGYSGLMAVDSTPRVVFELE